MNETTTPTITPTRTAPSILPEPGRRLRPDTICPGQTQRIARRGEKELGR